MLVSDWRVRHLGVRSVACLVKGKMSSCGMLARRVVETETPVMVQRLDDKSGIVGLCLQIQELIRGAGDAMSLAQFIWQPPKQALEKVKDLVWEPSVSRYGADDGLPELREALVEKGDLPLQLLSHLFPDGYYQTSNMDSCLMDSSCSLSASGNKLYNSSVMVTAGANQMTGVTNILVGPSNPKTLHPDAVCWVQHVAWLHGNSSQFREGSGGVGVERDRDWLEKILLETKPAPKVVTVVNPGNPSGTYIPEPLLKVCRSLQKCWILACVDNTYEYFMYDGLKHTCVEGDHIVNIFSFSKAYGMMGWRVGYIAYPSNVEGLGAQLLKISHNGCTLPLGKDSVKGGEGAIYLFAKLPDKYHDDFEVVRWLARKHRVVVIPGSACGTPGSLRVSFGGLREDETQIAAGRLKKGIEELVRDGMLQ
ncbi:Aromatic aminotransferase ISS1 [Vitis vinifera]|uniref:Aromatic aminotransferase ISS1 n=1 Tax=Vitis vinifera TaxID=29760 RepID=A0A438GZL3_VITVI|nr:Aromatic aminotransferase ISS1 [Vitis vinifera]